MKKDKKPSALFRLTLCVLILAAGIGGFIILKKMKKPPVAKPLAEASLPVTVMTVQPQDFPVTIHGYGNVVSRTRVTLAAEVSGRITAKREQLLPGLIVEKGEVLFEIDRKDYQLDFTTAGSLLKILNRDLEIATAELKRVDTLYHKNKVGSLSAVEKAEAAVNAIRNQMHQVRQNKEKAEIQLARCVVRAPFTGRVSAVEVEENEYVTPGKKMLTLIDDTALEVVVPLDSRDAANWLRLSAGENRADGNWFAAPEPVSCNIFWSEDSAVQAKGIVDRIVHYDPKTRMVSVAVSLVQDGHAPFPLVDGMFSRVTIPGRILRQIYVVPREAVTFTDTVYVVENGRLHTRKVKVVREEEDSSIIGRGLAPGDMVIITRLENPLENSLVRIAGKQGQ
jgi:RND family efflux transporter MFP subunit